MLKVTNCPLITDFFLLSISSLILLWLENIFDMISIHLKLLKLILCPSVGFILDNGSCALKSMCILLLLGEKFSIFQVKLVIVLLKSSAILLLFYFFLKESYCEKSIEINYNYWVVYFCYNYVRNCLIYLGTLFKCIYSHSVAKPF